MAEALIVEASVPEVAISFGDVVITPDEMLQLEEMAKKIEEERQLILSTLATSIQNKFDERQARRSIKEAEWLESMRLYLGSLSGIGRMGNPLATPATYFGANNNNRRPDHNLVRSKCLTALAQGISQQFSGGDKNWDINPPISPDVDRRQANAAAEKMEEEINDQLTATRYGPKCRLAYEDRVVLGTGILKGPVPEPFSRLTYRQEMTENGPVNVPVYEAIHKPVLFRVDPWMFFPDDTVNDIVDAEDAIELHPYSKSQLRALKKNKGFYATAIDKVLEDDPKWSMNPTFSEYSSITGTGHDMYRDKYAVLEYHGPVTKTVLDTLEIDPPYESPTETYYGEVWACNGTILRVELAAIDGLFELPYSVCPWVPDPNSIFGFGNPQVLKDPQRIATQTLHMILDNASASSRSQLVINRELVEPADGDWTIVPGKIWQNSDYTMGNVTDAFKFFDVPNQTGALMPVLQLAREFAQEESALPQMVTGMESAQVGSDSATGLALLQQNSTIVSDFLAEQWDDNITEKIITRMYHWNMQYNPNPEIVGDFEVDVRSSTEYRNKQMVLRDIEKLSVESAQNPELARLINQSELQRARLNMMHLPSSSIIKSEQQIQEEEEAAAQNPQPDPAMIELQLRERELAIKEQTNQIEMQKIQFELGAAQQREAWEHEERMAAQQARMAEAQASVLKSQTEERIAMIQLAQKDETQRAAIMAGLEETNIKEDTKKFIAGQNSQLKFSDQQIRREEAELKRQTGSGY